MTESDLIEKTRDTAVEVGLLDAELLAELRQYEAIESSGVCVELNSKWFIWTTKGRAPQFAHDTESSALLEAQRLALLNPGKKYHVMKSVAKLSVIPEQPTPAGQP